MSSKSRDQKIYVKQLPETKKWLNECVICGSIGYKLELPEKIHPGFMAENIRSLYAPLAINDINLCEQCSRHWNKTDKK